MATAKKTTRKPFLATVTPSAVRKGDTKLGHRFTTLPAATVSRKGVKDITRTVMAFGRANRTLARSFKPGKPIEVMVRWDGGSLVIADRAPAAKAA